MTSFTKTFPSDILERILAFSMLGLAGQQRARQARTLSLVHRSWTRWAQRLALGEVEVSGRPALMRFDRRLEELDATGVVRALTIRCRTSTDGSGLTPPSEWISPTDLAATLKHTPKLARLAVSQPDFSPLPAGMEALSSSSAIQHLTYFALTALAHQTCETLITTILENAPLLRTLTLSGGPVIPSHRFRPVQRFPPKLHVLVVDSVCYNSVLFSGEDPLLPIAAYAALEELAVPVAFGAARLASEVLEKAAATLRTLVIPVQGLSTLWHHLPRLTSLVNLVIGTATPTLDSLPSTAFAALPPTLRYLSIRNINLWGQELLLKHLKCDLTLLDLGWSWYGGLLRTLPPSLRTLKVAPHAQLAPDLFALAQATPSPSPSPRGGLEKIELCPSAGEAVDAVYLRSIQWACGVLGVALVVK